MAQLTDFDWLNGETDEADKVLIEKIGKWVDQLICKRCNFEFNLLGNREPVKL